MDLLPMDVLSMDNSLKLPTITTTFLGGTGDVLSQKSGALRLIELGYQP